MPPRGVCTMPVLTWTVRMPAAAAGVGRPPGEPGHHVGQEPLAARAGLGQHLLAPVRAVDVPMADAVTNA